MNDPRFNEETRLEAQEVLSAVRSRELVPVGSPFPEGTRARRTRTGTVVVDYSEVPKPPRKPISPEAAAVLAFAAGLKQT